MNRAKLNLTEEEKNAAIQGAAKDKFIETLIETGSIGKSCEAIGISRMTAHRWKSSDIDFARQWSVALDMFRESVDDRVHEAAMIGTREVVIHEDGTETINYTPSEKALLYLHDKFHPKQSGGHHPAAPPDMDLSSSRTADVLFSSEQKANVLLDHRLSIEDGTTPIETATPAVKDRAVLEAFRSANTIIDQPPVKLVTEKDGSKI